MLTPQNADANWLSELFCPSLLAAKAYKIHQEPDVKVKLDQNECPFDWPREIKQLVADRLVSTPWNRYPDPFCHELTERIAQHWGVVPSAVLTGPGSNFLVTLIFDAILPNIKGQTIIARPSFALFEEHCRYGGYNFIPWHLNANFDFDIAALPPMPVNSVLIFASPNNPTGAFLEVQALRDILHQNPRSLIVADEAYFEFAQDSYLPLLREFSNLLIIRTLSKTLASAGIRLGAIVGPPNIIEQIAKRRLPYLLNQFTRIAISTLLSEPTMQSFVDRHIRHIKGERQIVFDALEAHCKSQGIFLKNTQTNFLFMRFESQDACMSAYQSLLKSKVLVRNISAGPMLGGCLRLSLGTGDENQTLIKACREIKFK